jgi:murein DD-endopeptidase MepM/ murein hydrolase activator NlpD
MLLTAGCGHAPPLLPARVAEQSDCGHLGWPVDGPLSSPFGRRDGRPHEGVDLAVPDGTPVRAACGGVVAYAGAKLAGYGRLIMLTHPDGRTTVYAHNQALLVRVGEVVKRGQVIARSGHSGRATAPHVHFEVRTGGERPVPVDPLAYLDAPAPSAVGALRAPVVVRAAP